MASGVPPRRGWLLQRSARVVWLMRVSSVARGRLERLHVVFRSSLNARKEVLKLDGRSGTFGFSRDYRRWGEDFVAPRAEWRVLVDSWVSGEGCWRVELGGGGLEREFAGVLISDRKMG